MCNGNGTCTCQPNFIDAKCYVCAPTTYLSGFSCHGTFLFFFALSPRHSMTKIFQGKKIALIGFDGTTSLVLIEKVEMNGGVVVRDQSQVRIRSRFLFFVSLFLSLSLSLVLM